MRRADREIKDHDRIIEIIGNCDVCRIALNNNGYPYIIPLNFGICADNGKIELYFHGASEGTKYNLIETDNRAAFEMDCLHRLVFDDEKGSCTMEYESVAGTGIIESVSESDEKYKALYLIMKHYRREDFPINRLLIPKTSVLKLSVNQLTAKSHIT